MQFTKFTGKHLCQSLFFNEVAIRKIHRKQHLRQSLFSQNTLGDNFCFFLYYLIKNKSKQNSLDVIFLVSKLLFDIHYELHNIIITLLSLEIG